jgi:hypothetical protein
LLNNAVSRVGVGKERRVANILFLALDPFFVSRIVEGLELDSDRIELVKQRGSIDPTLHHIALAFQAGIQSRSAMLLTA